jgi:hypothetical protein
MAMSGSRFELMLDKAMTECVSALLVNPPGNPDKDTMLKAKHAAFIEAKRLYREATRTDDDEGDRV